mmetsp:Transcript_8629/g.23095  ORF Transcript_8629/g.23095 Transcript_8629/m.23095 type:complete len:294 (-) Transcript_8629:844-1725(-)
MKCYDKQMANVLLLLLGYAKIQSVSTDFVFVLYLCVCACVCTYVCCVGSCSHGCNAWVDFHALRLWLLILNTTSSNRRRRRHVAILTLRLYRRLRLGRVGISAFVQGEETPLDFLNLAHIYRRLVRRVWHFLEVCAEDVPPLLRFSPRRLDDINVCFRHLRGERDRGDGDVHGGVLDADGGTQRVVRKVPCQLLEFEVVDEHLRFVSHTRLRVVLHAKHTHEHEHVLVRLVDIELERERVEHDALHLKKFFVPHVVLAFLELRLHHGVVARIRRVCFRTRLVQHVVAHVEHVA